MLKTLAILGPALLLHTAAMAQATDEPVDVSRIRFVGPVASGGYSSRATTAVFAIGTPAETGGDYRASGTNVYDDVTLGGPTAAVLPVHVTGVTVGLILPATLPPPPNQVYARFSFYPNHVPSALAPASPYSGTPVVGVADLIVSPPAPVPAPLSVTLDGSNVFNGGPQDRTMGVKIELFADAALTLRATSYQVARRGMFTNPLVGSTDAIGWISTASDVESGEIPNATSNRTGTTYPNSRGTFLTLYADSCGPQDFNGDGDSGTDQDIEAFFACLGGNCCATCWPGGADFNGDGDTGTDQDIEAFFRVLSGGAC